MRESKRRGMWRRIMKRDRRREGRVRKVGEMMEDCLVIGRGGREGRELLGGDKCMVDGWVMGCGLAWYN